MVPMKQKVAVSNYKQKKVTRVCMCIVKGRMCRIKNIKINKIYFKKTITEIL